MYKKCIIYYNSALYCLWIHLHITNTTQNKNNLKHFVRRSRDWDHH